GNAPPMYSLYVFRTASRLSPMPVLRQTGRNQFQVGLQSVQASLPAEPALLVAAERRRRVEPVERVGPNHAGPKSLGHPQDARALLRPHPRREAVGRVVRLL